MVRFPFTKPAKARKRRIARTWGAAVLRPYARDWRFYGRFTVKPLAAANWPSWLQTLVCGTDGAAPRMPPDVERYGAPRSGAFGCGSVGTETFGFSKFSAWARFDTSLLASRSVRGAGPQRHSISFRTEVWSNTRSLTRGSFACPALKGEATTVGTRNPRSAFPLTRSGSTLFRAVARGGAICSKKPPHSPKFTPTTPLAHLRPPATASTVPPP